MKCHTLVVGAGVMGSSAAYALSKSGVDTLLVDQFPIPNSRGSSGGFSRIIRQANYGEPELGPIMEKTYMLWKKIEKESGLTLIKNFPLLCAGSDRNEKLSKIKENMITSVQKACNSPVLDAEQANQIYGTNLPSDCKVIVDKTAGVMKVDQCMKALQNLFVKHGGKIQGNVKIQEIIPQDKNGDIKVVTSSEVIMCKSIIICAGPWSSPLLSSLGINLPPLQVVKVGVYYWQTKNPLNSEYILIDRTSNSPFYYLPPMEYEGLGKAAYHGGPAVNPDLRDLADLSEVKRNCKDWIANTLPALHPEPVIEESCLYTITPDWSPIVDVHPTHKNIVYACGFSGSGFKLGPICGEELAKLALGQRPSKEFEYYTSKRYAEISKL